MFPERPAADGAGEPGEPVTASAGERPAADGVVGASSHWKDLRL